MFVLAYGQGTDENKLRRILPRNPFDTVNTLPGTVQGPNPKNIPEDKLPECDFWGGGFVEEPCYSPPDAFYI